MYYYVDAFEFSEFQISLNKFDALMSKILICMTLLASTRHDILSYKNITLNIFSSFMAPKYVWLPFDIP